MAFIVLPGADASGNGNDWTANNINNTDTSSTTYDIMTDVPTLTDEDTANYCVMNPLGTNDISTFSEANLKVTTGSGASTTGTTFAMSSGKWYAEFVCTAKTSVNMYIGLVEASTFDGDNQGDEGTNNGYIYSNAGNIYHGGANEAYGASWTVGDVMAIAFDADTRNVTFYKNNVSQGVYTRIASENTGGDWLMVVSEGQGAATATFVANFGQRPFAYTPPTGYLKLNTFNLPDSSIVDGSENFNTVLYTGDGVAIASGGQPITGVGFSPDFVWVKSRGQATNHFQFDTIRGATNFLRSSTTNEEGTNAETLNSFDTDGFTVGNSTSFNTSPYEYVAWNWKAGGTAVTNTAGSITSQVSANPTAGFSVVTYSGTGVTGETVGHGLNVPPSMIIWKNRASAGTNWITYHKELGVNQYIFLNLSNAAATNANTFGVSSSTFTLGTTTPDFNGTSMVAYCFADVEGYSKIGSYTGNASADGPFVYTGFRPAFILQKNTNAAYGWLLWDTSRSSYNMVTKYLVANTSDAEADTAGAQGPNIDILSNGFKVRDPNPGWNESGSTHIYMAFAENPFKNSLAR